MNITVNYSDLAEMANVVVNEVTTELDNGYKLISHAAVKPYAKTVLWMYEQPVGFADTLDPEQTLAELYLELEDKGELEIDKKDQGKYKYFLERIYGLISNIEAENDYRKASALMGVAQSMNDFVELANQLQQTIGELNTENLTETAKALSESLAGTLK